MLSTPDISHLKREDYNYVYEPDADSFLLLDALELKQQEIIERNPVIVLEFGPGSGLATSFIAKHFSPSSRLFIAVDINSYACQTTIRTFKQNQLHEKHPLCVIQSDLAGCCLARLATKVDLMIFNPPYVPSETADVNEMIERAYAGGENGLEVIERAIEQASQLLSEKGVFYLLALEANGFDRLKQIADRFHLTVEMILQRSTSIERLFVVEIRRK